MSIEHFHTHFGHAGGGDAQETACDDLAQFNQTVTGQEIPTLALVAGVAGLFSGVGQIVQGIGCQTSLLHGVVVELFAVHTAGDRTQVDVAAAGHQIGAHHIGQHIGVDAVERQRQTNGHRGGCPRTRQGGRQSRSTCDRVDGGLVFSAHADLARFDAQWIGRVAQHTGLQAGGDAVFGIGPSRTQAVGRRAGACTHSGCGGQDCGLDLGRAEGLQVQIACGLH